MALWAPDGGCAEDAHAGALPEVLWSRANGQAKDELGWARPGFHSRWVRLLLSPGPKKPAGRGVGVDNPRNCSRLGFHRGLRLAQPHKCHVGQH